MIHLPFPRRPQNTLLVFGVVQAVSFSADRPLDALVSWATLQPYFASAANWIFVGRPVTVITSARRDETTTCRRRTCSAYTCLPLYHITYAFVVPHNTELFHHKMVADIKYIEENRTRSSATAEKQRVSCPHGGG